ncbi:hypothetical protein, partial [Sphaerotilus sp. FB-3]|uniref:hypothetical protein n=1 Tax=Sphaerotilus sp. FB-3 TaxID=2913396 RepID=UPI0020408490
MRTHANDFQPVVAAVAAVASAKASGKASRGVLLLAGPPLAGAEPIEVEGLPVGAAALPVSLAALHQMPGLEVLPLLAGPLPAGAEPVEVECLPSGAEGRCRGAAGRPGHA